MFFGELVKKTGLLPSRVEQALGELAAHGWATADSFEGLRALLMPQEKRTPFADTERKRRHKAVSSVEFAGRWSLLRFPIMASVENGLDKEGVDRPVPKNGSKWNGVSAHPNSENPASTDAHERDAAVELFARALLRRYGVVFRRLLDRESFNVSWYELGRVYRRLEARGEIRGGHFVSGVSGEQFALPEAIGSLRALRKSAPKGELVAISGADPLNLVGILTPGPRISAITANRILLRDGVAVAAVEGGQFIQLESPGPEPDSTLERALRIGSLPAALRPYYAHH
jgi:ATP-dependent Lhr-like helicase